MLACQAADLDRLDHRLEHRQNALTRYILFIDLFNVLLKKILTQEALRLHDRAALEALLCLLELLIRCRSAEGVHRINGTIIGPESFL